MLANDIVATLYRGQINNFTFMGILADVLVSKGGYNMTDALNAEKGPRAAELAREFLGSTGSSSTGSYTNTQSYEDILNQSKKYIQDLINPAIEQIKSQIPQIEQAYGTEKTRLEGTKQTVKDRYTNLINQIKGNQAQAETGQRTITSEEMARRGIPLESGLVQQTIQNAIAPITSEYTNKLTEANTLQGEELSGIDQLIANLAMSQLGATGNTNTAIANLLSGGAGQTLSTAGNIYSAQQQAAQQAAALQAQKEYQDKQLAQAQKEYEEVTKPTSQAQIKKIQSDIATGGSSDLGDLTSLISLLGLGDLTSLISSLGLGSNIPQSVNPTEPKPKWIPSKSGVAYHSAGGQWFWDSKTKEWIPVQL